MRGKLEATWLEATHDISGEKIIQFWTTNIKFSQKRKQWINSWNMSKVWQLNRYVKQWKRKKQSCIVYSGDGQRAPATSLALSPSVTLILLCDRVFQLTILVPHL